MVCVGVEGPLQGCIAGALEAICFSLARGLCTSQTNDSPTHWHQHSFQRTPLPITNDNPTGNTSPPIFLDFFYFLFFFFIFEGDIKKNIFHVEGLARKTEFNVYKTGMKVSRICSSGCFRITTYQLSSSFFFFFYSWRSLTGTWLKMPSRL